MVTTLITTTTMITECNDNDSDPFFLNGKGNISKADGKKYNFKKCLHSSIGEVAYVERKEEETNFRF